jgi:hypothetical protein
MISCTTPAVPVTGFAQTFLDDKRIPRATVTWLENKLITTTDTKGNFGFCVLPNQKMTLVFSDADYPSTQTATVTVPATGLTTIYNQPTFQVPREITYTFLKALLTQERSIKLDTQDCQVVTTVTDFHKTLQDDPQGIPGATIRLMHNGQSIALNPTPFYFGMFKDGKTNPFSKKLTSTSADGGVALINIKPSNTPYTLTASKKEKEFTQVKFLCRPGQLVNISPPLGPMSEFP